MNVLEEANQLTSGDRNKSYGHPREDFNRAAALWSTILGAPVTAKQVAMCMICTKLSRECHASKRDNLTDIAGYARTIEMLDEDTQES